MEFKVSNYNNSLYEALYEANNGLNPKENIVIVDTDCDETEDSFEDSNGAKPKILDYIRIKGAQGVKHTIKNYALTCNGDVYLKDIKVTTENFTGTNDHFIKWNDNDEVVNDASIYIDGVDVTNHRLFVCEPDASNKEVKYLQKIRMKNCTFKNCYGSMLRLYSKCDDAKVYKNTYTDPYCDVESNLTITHNLVTLGSSRSVEEEENVFVYYRYPINNVEVFDNVMIGTFMKNGISSIENIYYNGIYGAESHLCSLHGNNLNVHDNLYRGWVMINNEQLVDTEPIMIKGSNVKVTGNTIEDCTMGEGAIALKGSYGDIEIANNTINPGYDVKQLKVDSDDDGVYENATYALIQLQSLGGKEVDCYEANVKIHSNHLVYKRKKDGEGKYPNCKSAIYFNSLDDPKTTVDEFFDKKINAEICDNYFEGITDFIRCSQESKDVKMVVDNNTVKITGEIPGVDSGLYLSSNACSSALVSTGVNNFDNNMDIKISRNKGNVGVVFFNDFVATQLYNEKYHTKVLIRENDILTKKVFLSTSIRQHKNSDGTIVDNANLDKNISIYILSNKFSFRNENDKDYTKSHGGGALQSKNADVVFKGNVFEFSNKFLPHTAFSGNNKTSVDLKIRSITATDNVFVTEKKGKYSDGEFYFNGGTNNYNDHSNNNSLIYCESNIFFDSGNVLI